MVKKMTLKEQEILATALKNAEAKTSALIKTIILPASDRYQNYILVYALILGSITAYGLWASQIIQDFPWLLVIQLGIVAVCDLVHGISPLFIALIPRRIRHTHAAHKAMQEYHALHAHVPADKPFILLFVSLAERYVHVITNPVVHQALPGDWRKITDDFGHSVRRQPLGASCATAVTQIAEIVSAAFPTT